MSHFLASSYRDYYYYYYLATINVSHVACPWYREDMEKSSSWRIGWLAVDSVDFCPCVHWSLDGRKGTVKKGDNDTVYYPVFDRT
eukprot:scaffold158_cov105-Cylindrotheca_fusiformis.AAC.14